MRGLCLVLTLWIVVEICSSARILLIPSPNKSHVMFFSVTAKGLKEGGHDVRLLMMDSRKSFAEKNNVTSITYTTSEESNLIGSDDVVQEMLSAKATNIFKLFSDMTRAANSLCESMHSDEILMNELEQNHFDLVLIDGFDIVRCFYTIPYRLGVPYITLTARHDPWNAGIPALPSVEPLASVGSFTKDPLTFSGRVMSLFQNIMVWNALPPSVLEDSMIAKVCPTKPKTTFMDLFKKSEMWLVNLETICLDIPRVSGSHYQYVAGMGLEQAKPLPSDLEAFVKGARNGIIIFTFGSNLKNIPEEMMGKFIEAFAQVPNFRIIMRHSGDIPKNLPENVKILSWLPQNDLLGHPKARAFITHGGTNGQLEGLFHAVPMITIPMFGDQFYNAQRVQQKGFGVTLDRNTFTAEELLSAIRTVAGQKEHRNNIRKCSERFRSMPAAQDTIGFWVEHVVRFGGGHLKPVALDVPLWKMFMLDIVMLLLVVVLVLYTCILCCCLKVRRVYSNKYSHSKDE